MALWTWPDAQHIGVIDGDTITMRLTKTNDIGFGGTQSATFNTRLRLNRINAPKATSLEGKAATVYLNGLLTIGATYKAETMKPYKYGGPDWSPGEWMVEVTLSDGRNVSDLMVESGFAAYWDGEGPRPNDG